MFALFAPVYPADTSSWLTGEPNTWGEQEAPPDKDVGTGHGSFTVSGAGTYVLCYTVPWCDIDRLTRTHIGKQRMWTTQDWQTPHAVELQGIGLLSAAVRFSSIDSPKKTKQTEVSSVDFSVFITPGSHFGTR